MVILHHGTLATMDSDQFGRYLDLLDHPPQLTLGPDVTSLYLIYQHHMTRFAYSSIDLYLGRPPAEISVDATMDDLPVRGGHCFQHVELLFNVLEYLGFEATRVLARVLDGDTYIKGMTINHIFLLVKFEGDTYLFDPGLAYASPRFSISIIDLGNLLLLLPYISGSQ